MNDYKPHPSFAIVIQLLSRRSPIGGGGGEEELWSTSQNILSCIPIGDCSKGELEFWQSTPILFPSSF